ncbi:MAG TPA: ATP cone domain-containing protein [Candidatus Paceibacterota bacterium]|nr:ATP cone domain-containing protein [Candidatus Paceibacterota bacterium]
MAKNIKTAQKTSKKIGTKVSKVTEVKKRDGTVVPFDESKITNAVLKAMKAVAEGGEKEATKVAAAVTTLISNTKKEQGKDYLPTVEEIQDLVEKELILQKYSSTAKAYILYREKRAEIRKQKGEVPREVKNLVTESKKYFRNQLSEFVYYTTYSR